MAMTPEEFERIKEAEKEHLRALKKLKEAVRQKQRTRSLTKTVTDMAASSQSALDTNDSAIEELALETARNEARLEMALASARLSEERVKDVTPMPAAGQPPDEEIQKIRARDLVRQLKQQLDSPDDLPADDADSSVQAQKSAKPTDSAADETPESDLPQKTIGRMK